MNRPQPPLAIFSNTPFPTGLQQPPPHQQGAIRNPTVMPFPQTGANYQTIPQNQQLQPRLLPPMNAGGVVNNIPVVSQPQMMNNGPVPRPRFPQQQQQPQPLQPQQQQQNAKFWNDPISSITKKFTEVIGVSEFQKGGPPQMNPMNPNRMPFRPPPQQQQQQQLQNQQPFGPRFGGQSFPLTQAHTQFYNNNNNTLQQQQQLQQPPFVQRGTRAQLFRMPMHNMNGSLQHPQQQQQLQHRAMLGYPQKSDTDRNMRIFCAMFDYDPQTMSPNVDGLKMELSFKEGQLIKVYGDCDEDGFFMGESNGSRGLVPSNLVFEMDLDDNSGGVLFPNQEAMLSSNQYDAMNFGINSTQQINENLHTTTGPQMIMTPWQTHEEELHCNNNNARFGQPRPILPQNSNNNLTAPAVASNCAKYGAGTSTLAPPTSSTLGAKIETGGSKRMRALYDYDPHVLSPNVDVEAELSFKAEELIIVHGEMDEDGFYMGEKTDGRRGLVPSNFLQPIAPDNQGQFFAQKPGEVSHFPLNQQPPNPSTIAQQAPIQRFPAPIATVNRKVASHT
ncbi:hypothetical protein Ciccas_000010 [Cichlidogyrus casuarinus]|uniref:SH3 domain-containing protein n=1 Tax=Cichlidogyrus casuarinus TaxID=1844966 RepID=A0ABD2QP63_9PLAT